MVYHPPPLFLSAGRSQFSPCSQVCMRTYASIYAESISVSAVFKSLLQAPQQQQRARLYRVSPCCSAELDFLGQGVDFSNPLPPTHSLQGSHRQEWRSGTGFKSLYFEYLWAEKQSLCKDRDRCFPLVSVREETFARTLGLRKFQGWFEEAQSIMSWSKSVAPKMWHHPLLRKMLLSQQPQTYWLKNSEGTA